MNFNNGNANNNNKTNSNYVRCVRGGAWAPVHGDLFSFENLERAYRACRKRKRGTCNAMRFEAGLLDNLCALREELRSRSYRPSSSICFVQPRPKLREVFAADFRDRVVHHLLVGFLEPIFEPRFIYDSYACRVGKGTHAAVERLRGFLRQATANGQRRAWYLKEDVSGFFMHIDKRVLFEQIVRRVDSPQALWLAKTVIDHDCTRNFRLKGDRALLARIPPHKSLLHAPSGKGLPIGNLTSQFFANVYLDELDQFVKRRLRVRHYLRYCDDFLLLGQSPQELADHRNAMEGFLRERLLLDLNAGQHRLRPAADGIDFLGYVVRPGYTLVRRRVVNHLRERLSQYTARLAEKRRGEVVGWRYPIATVERFRATLASYLGHFKWADARRLTESIWRRQPVVRAVFMRDGDRLLPRYAPPTRLYGLRKAYGWWLPRGRAGAQDGQREYPGALEFGTRGEASVLVFFQVGRFYEFYGDQALLASRVLKLARMTGLRGFLHGCGFHKRWLGRFQARAMQAGYHVAVIGCERRADGKPFRHLVRLMRGKAAAAHPRASAAVKGQTRE